MENLSSHNVEGMDHSSAEQMHDESELAGSRFSRFAEQATVEMGDMGLNYEEISQQLMNNGKLPGTKQFVEGILDAMNIDNQAARHLITNGLLREELNTRQSLNETLQSAAEQQPTVDR